MKPAPKFLDELDRYWQPKKKENWQDKIDKQHKGQTGFFKQLEQEQLKQNKMYLEKIQNEAQYLLEKFNDNIEHAVLCANECYVALSQLPHIDEEVSKAIYKQLDFYRDVLEELNNIQ